jgi:hypothetical protein
MFDLPVSMMIAGAVIAGFSYQHHYDAWLLGLLIGASLMMGSVLPYRRRIIRRLEELEAEGRYSPSHNDHKHQSLPEEGQTDPKDRPSS